MVDVEVVRDGLEPRVVYLVRYVALPHQEMPDGAPEQGCAWEVVETIPTDETWQSGLYLVRVDGLPAGWFVVRAAATTAAADRPLLVLATNTWNAYNEYGGRNLYTGATHQSFERPLSLGLLSKPVGDGARVVTGAAYAEYTTVHGLSFWHGMAGWAGQERAFVRWAEREGIELDYAINADLADVSDLLDHRAVYVSVGHDEYWSWGMRDAVESFVDRGGRAVFLSGNTSYWQVRIEGSVMVCFKHRYEEDPFFEGDDGHLTTTMWSDPGLNRPETEMTGVTFTRGGYARTHRSVPRGSGGYEVHRPDHWLFEGTRVRRGDVIGGEHVVVGYECDGCDLTYVDGLPVATGGGGTPGSFEVVATSPATPFDRDNTPLPLAPGGEYELEFHARRLLGAVTPANCEKLRNGHAVMGAFTRGRGDVVTVGCTEWAYGLDDPVVAQVTRNALSPR